MTTFFNKNSRTSKEFPRRYLNNGDNLSHLGTIKRYTRDLLIRNPADLQELEGLLDDYTEFYNATSEEYARLYIQNTMNTLLKDRERSFTHFAEIIQPHLEEFNNQFQKNLHSQPLKNKLPVNIYGLWLKSILGRLKLFNKKNLAINVKITRLIQKYQKMTAGMTVTWLGKEKTFAEMSLVLQEKNRSIREQAWFKVSHRRLEDKKEFEKLYGDLLRQREKTAKNLGLKNYREFSFKNYERTDYTPKHCLAFHKTIREIVVPCYQKILAKKAVALGLKKLRPWDLDCDAYSDNPLKPYRKSDEFLKKTGKVFKKIDVELYKIFQLMVSRKLLDFKNRKGKAPGGYQCTLDEVRLPFIFMNAVGSHSDVMTLLHEGGHAFHMYLSRKRDLPFNREAPMEFCEVASMSMEQFGLEYLNEFYNSGEKLRAVLGEKEEVLHLLIWVAIIDKFQHWIYTHKGHTARERKNYWLKLHREFDTGIDWTGLEHFLEVSWHKQLHLFEVPFYYIEYGIAQLGALQFLSQFKKNKRKALKNYKCILNKGGTLGLKDLFENAGLKFDFTAETVKPLINQLYRDWTRLHESLSKHA